MLCPKQYFRSQKGIDFNLNKGGCLNCPIPKIPGVTCNVPIIQTNGDTVYQTKDCDKEEQKVTFGKLT